MGAENEPGNAEQKRRVARIRTEIAEERLHINALWSGGLGAPVRIHKARIGWLQSQLWEALK